MMRSMPLDFPCLYFDLQSAKSLYRAKGSPASFYFSLIILFAFYGLVYATVEGTQRAFVSDFAPKELRGMALELFTQSSGWQPCHQA